MATQSFRRKRGLNRVESACIRVERLESRLLPSANPLLTPVICIGPDLCGHSGSDSGTGNHQDNKDSGPHTAIVGSDLLHLLDSHSLPHLNTAVKWDWDSLLGHDDDAGSEPDALTLPPSLVEWIQSSPYIEWLDHAFSSITCPNDGSSGSSGSSGTSGDSTSPPNGCEIAAWLTNFFDNVVDNQKLDDLFARIESWSTT